MSFLRIAISRSRAAGSLTRSRVSTAERSEVSGFLISWATSAANRSMASIRSDRDWVMSSSETVRSPISSSRCASCGSEIARARDIRTRSAARASIRTGWAIRLFSRIDEVRLTKMAIRMNGASA